MTAVNNSRGGATPLPVDARGTADRLPPRHCGEAGIRKIAGLPDRKIGRGSGNSVRHEDAATPPEQPAPAPIQPDRSGPTALAPDEVDAVTALLVTVTELLVAEPFGEPAVAGHIRLALRRIDDTVATLGRVRPDGDLGGDAERRTRPVVAADSGVVRQRPTQGAGARLAEAWTVLANVRSPLADDLAAAARHLHHADIAAHREAVR